MPFLCFKSDLYKHNRSSNFIGIPLKLGMRILAFIIKNFVIPANILYKNISNEMFSFAVLYMLIFVI